MGWIIFWIVITIVAIIIVGVGLDSAEGGFATWIILALIGGLVWLMTAVCAPCQDKKGGSMGDGAVAVATANAEQTPEAEATEEPTPTPYPYGTEVYLDPKKDGHNSKIGEVNCSEKLIVKGSANTIDGYYYLVVPECSANQKNYLPNVMNDEDSLTTEAPDAMPCGCGSEYSSEPTPEPTEED